MKSTLLTTVNLFKRVVSRSLCHNNVHLCGSMLRGNRGGMGERPRCDDVQRRTSSLLFFAVVLLLVALCNPGCPYRDEVERDSNDLCLLDRRQVRFSRLKNRKERRTASVITYTPLFPVTKVMKEMNAVTVYRRPDSTIICMTFLRLLILAVDIPLMRLALLLISTRQMHHTSRPSSDKRSSM